MGKSSHFTFYILHSRRSRSGQAIVELMVAMSVLIVVLIGVYDLVAESLHFNRTVTDKYTAIYLASEGIEIVKNIIDHNFILRAGNPSQSWYAGLSDGNFEADYSSQSLTSYAGKNLHYNPATGLYGYSGPLPTSFIRKIHITLNKDAGTGAVNRLTVDSDVSWSTGLLSSDVDVADMFFNWRP